MPRLVLECQIELPTDLVEHSKIIGVVGPQWNALLDALKATGAEFQEKSAISEVRYPAPGAKRGRKPKGHWPRPAAAPAPDEAA